MIARRSFRLFSPRVRAPRVGAPRAGFARCVIGALSLAVLFSAAAPALAGKVECDRSKKYRLTERHGPWMIMVAAIHPLRGGNRDGTTPAEAADLLVYDLREQGIPAYAYAIDTETQTVATRTRTGEEKAMLMATQRGGVCVMAGNFKTADDPRAESGLKFIKTRCKCPSLMPVAATGWTGLTKAGGFFKLTPGRNGSPLARAFITVNPLLSADQVRRLSAARDPLLERLNAGEEYSLHKCPGKYSVMVKEFRGQTLTQVSGTKSEDLAERVKMSGDLGDAGRQAWELCQLLRNREKVDAYVWHDRRRSVVTVGSFDSPRDPAAVRTARKYGARPKTGSGSLTPVLITVPEGMSDIRHAKRYWMLDPSPYAMPVPRL